MDRTLPHCVALGEMDFDALVRAEQLPLLRLASRLTWAQQALERLLRAEKPPENVVLTQVERVGAAETAIRNNRVALMLRIREVLGPQTWSKLQLELELERRLARRAAQTEPSTSSRMMPSRLPKAQLTPARVGEPVEVETVSGTVQSNGR